MEALGIDLVTIIAQVVNFGLLVFVLNRFLYKPVLKAINAKKAEYEQIARDKEAVVKAQENMNTKREQLIKGAQKEKTDTVKEARLEATVIKKEALEKAQKEAKSIIEKAKKEIEVEKAKLQKNYDQAVLEAAFALADKVVSNKKELEQVKRALRGK